MEALGRERGGILEPTVSGHGGEATEAADAAGQTQSEARKVAYGEATGAMGPMQVHLY